MRPTLSRFLAIGLGLALLASSACRARTAAKVENSPLTPEAAYQMAVSLQHQGRHMESIDHFRRALAAHPDIAQLHLELGESLHNAAIQTDLRYGFVRYSVASSLERLALEREAITELQAAEATAASPAERSQALFSLARIQSQLGLVCDAVVSIREARRLSPSVRVLETFEAALTQRLDAAHQMR